MKGNMKRLLVLLMAFVMSFSVVVPIKADNAAHQPKSIFGWLKEGKGKSTQSGTVKGDDWHDKKYKMSGGGYKNWIDLFELEDFSNENVNLLTQNSRREFLQDVFSLAQKQVQYNQEMNSNDGVNTADMDFIYERAQHISGMGSQMLATLLANTKPDYATANRIYAPFSGPIGVILGFLAIIIMALLGVTMALDIAYITIPALQLALTSDEGGGKEAKGMSKIISAEARSAVQQTDSGNSGDASGKNKTAIGIYFKARWKGLFLLGICLLYLVQGQIYTLVAWFIDLVSGFLDF